MNSLTVCVHGRMCIIWRAHYLSINIYLDTELSCSSLRFLSATSLVRDMYSNFSLRRINTYFQVHIFSAGFHNPYEKYCFWTADPTDSYMSLSFVHSPFLRLLNTALPLRSDSETIKEENKKIRDRSLFMRYMRVYVWFNYEKR